MRTTVEIHQCLSSFYVKLINEFNVLNDFTVIVVITMGGYKL